MNNKEERLDAIRLPASSLLPFLLNYLMIHHQKGKNQNLNSIVSSAASVQGASCEGP